VTPYIPLSSVSLSEREHGLVREAMSAGLLSSAGPFVTAFEEAFAARLGIGHVIATASGTSALELALRALDVVAGDEVIVPALTFVAPAAAVALVGAIPVIADVTAETWTLDPQDVARRITSRTRAIVTVDVLGHPCDYDELTGFGLPILEDAAEAIGARYKGRLAGTLGAASIFSFHANKPIATGEGGCVATDDAVIAARVRQLNNFGMSTTRRYWHEVAGHNHRMTNLTAAVGLGQVERWDHLVAERARIAAFYDRALAEVPVRRRPVAAWATEGTWLYTIESERRSSVLDACQRHGIDARAIWPAVPDQPAFRATENCSYPVAREVANRALWLPTWPGMPEDALHRVVRAVAEGAATTN
jgi:perosamine synthetase